MMRSANSITDLSVCSWTMTCCCVVCSCQPFSLGYVNSLLNRLKSPSPVSLLLFPCLLQPCPNKPLIVQLDLEPLHLLSVVTQTMLKKTTGLIRVREVAEKHIFVKLEPWRKGERHRAISWRLLGSGGHAVHVSKLKAPVQARREGPQPLISC